MGQWSRSIKAWAIKEYKMPKTKMTKMVKHRIHSLTYDASLFPTATKGLPQITTINILYHGPSWRGLRRYHPHFLNAIKK